MLLKFKVYEDLKGGFRWNLSSNNGRIMADSGEAYVDKNNAKEAINTIVQHIQTGAFDIEAE